MTYGIVCLLTALLSAGGTWLLCRYLLSRLGMRELGIKKIPAAVRDVPGEGEYVPRCGGLLPAAAMFAAAVIMTGLYALLCRLEGGGGVPRLSGVQSMYVLGGLVLAPLCCAAGFMEDYASVFRRVRGGLSGWQRAGVKVLIAAGYLAAVWLAGDRGAGMTDVPFAGQLRMGFWYYPLSLLLIVGTVQGAELLQEAEGALPAVGFFSFVPFIAAAGLAARGSASLADSGITAVAGACGCLVFIMYNFTPARALCGAAGGAFTGALLCAAAFSSGMPVLLVLTGGVYLAESATALAGGICRRLTGRELCPPLHRLIGRGGRNDIQITVILTAVTAVLSAAAAALALFGME